MSAEAATFHPTGSSRFCSPLVLTYARLLFLFLFFKIYLRERFAAPPIHALSACLLHVL